MEPNPYTFDEKNPRLVVDCNRDQKLLPLAGAIYLYSVYRFNKSRFRVDNNFLNMLGFTVAAAPASLAFSQTLVGSSEVEAGLLNNQRETGR